MSVRSADLKFTIVQPPKLEVKTTSLDFGQLLMGTTTARSIVISNAGAPSDLDGGYRRNSMVERTHRDWND